MTPVLQRSALPVSPRILVTDPEPASRAALGACLRAAQLAVDHVAHIEECRSRLQREPPSLLLFGSSLPAPAVLRFIDELCAASATRELPVLVLGSAPAEDLCVAVLEAGGDDFLARPFGNAELLARVRALLRRSAGRHPGRRLEYDGLVLDRDTGRLLAHDRPVALRPREMQLAHFLLSYPERLHPREALRELLSDAGRPLDRRSVDAQICRLRSALAPFGYAAYVQTVHGHGYRLSRNGTAGTGPGGHETVMPDR